MTRTFIALEMNEDVQRYLEGVIRQMAHVLPRLRWVDPAGIHLTLAFLGELTDEHLTEVTQAAEAAAQRMNLFSYRISSMGIFGSPKSPRIIWIGIDEPSGTLTRLHSMLNKELEQRGFDVDRRSFAPHLTLARVKAPLTQTEQKSLQEMLTKGGNVSSKEYAAQSIHVMKSELTREGAKYTSLREICLHTDTQ